MGRWEPKVSHRSEYRVSVHLVGPPLSYPGPSVSVAPGLSTETKTPPTPGVSSPNPAPSFRPRVRGLLVSGGGTEPLPAPGVDRWY